MCCAILGMKKYIFISRTDANVGEFDVWLTKWEEQGSSNAELWY